MVKRTIAQHMSCLEYSALYWYIGPLVLLLLVPLQRFGYFCNAAYDPLVKKKKKTTKPQKPQTCSADGMFNSICRSRLSS